MNAPAPRRLLRRALAYWLAFARTLSAAQMVVALTLVYWLFMPLAYLPFGLLSDPLRMRRRPGTSGSGWRPREAPDDVMAYLKRQW